MAHVVKKRNSVTVPSSHHRFVESSIWLVLFLRRLKEVDARLPLSSDNWIRPARYIFPKVLLLADPCPTFFPSRRGPPCGLVRGALDFQSRIG